MQLCVGCQDNAVWLNKTPVSPLKLHWNIMIDIQLSAEYLKFLDEDYNYTIKQSVENVREIAAMWVASGKIKKRLLIKASFITAVCIL